MTPAELLRFMRTQRLTVEASCAAEGGAHQAALVGIAVTDAFEIPARASWPGITYFRVRPSWIRFSDLNRAPAEITKFTSGQLTPRPLLHADD